MARCRTHTHYLPIEDSHLVLEITRLTAKLRQDVTAGHEAAQPTISLCYFTLGTSGSLGVLHNYLLVQCIPYTNSSSSFGFFYYINQLNHLPFLRSQSSLFFALKCSV